MDIGPNEDICTILSAALVKMRMLDHFHLLRGWEFFVPA